jgi:hypothetical protein
MNCGGRHDVDPMCLNEHVIHHTHTICMHSGVLASGSKTSHFLVEEHFYYISHLLNSS